MSSDADFLVRLAAALDRIQLDAVVVGNTGAILHGAPVLTEDVDLFVRDTPENRAKVEQLARRVGGARPVPVGDSSEVLRIHAEVPIDVLFWIGKGLPFGKVRARSCRVAIGKRKLTVAVLADIIRSKEIAGRPKDVASLPILRSTQSVIDAAGTATRGHREGRAEGDEEQ